jgi:acyl-CoA synthetase (NDP forming)
MGGSPAQQVLKGKSALPVLASSVKPVCFVMLGDAGPLGAEFMDLVMASKVPFLRSPDRAIRAMAHVHRYGRLCAAATQRDVATAGKPGAIRKEDSAGHEKGKLPGVLGIGMPAAEWRTEDEALGVAQAGPVAEYKGKRLLGTLGISTPAGELARTVDEALSVAARIGYPVVIKAQADQLTHKSDVGGVVVGVPDEAALRAGWHSMNARLAESCPRLPLDGILVEAMAPAGLEMVIGGRRDPSWGVVMMAGLGGVWIEALRDVRLFAPDMTQAQVVAELSKLKGARLLSGLRGSAPVDVAAVAQALRQLAGLMLANPQISEVDVNPLIALPEGKGVMALDALFVMA